MTRYLVTQAAQADLEAIWDDTQDRWGPHQAERYVRMIRVACDELAAGPCFKQAIDEIRPGYSRSTVGSHVVFFRNTGAGSIQVVRILHNRMDLTRHL